jgi:hypothetical protein
MCRFSAAGMQAYPHAPAAGGRKAPRHEVAGGRAPAEQRSANLKEVLDLGNSKSGDHECVHNLSVLARLMQKRGFNVVGPCDFK